MEEVKSEEKSKRRRGRRGKGGKGGTATTPTTMPSAFQVPQPQDDIISHNRSKIQVLREDHQEMLGTRAALEQDLSVAHQHLRQLVSTARKVREDTDLEVKAVLERSIGVESQLGSIQALQSEHAQVVAHVTTLTHSNIQLHSEFNRLDSELHRIRMDAAEVANLKADLHAMRLELRKGRGAIEFEKKTRSANLQQYQEMDTKITEMSNQIQTLRPHLPPSHPALGYAGASDSVFRAPYSSHYPMHQFQHSRLSLLLACCNARYVHMSSS
ncbi:protein FLC EXPRESSOR-like isoform X2 [Silene latifolia]|uniref:protein FLC EXPRESSOR-like isoform X2 n=1 Tax=Silene latifolia TaxID=37657 RepID=UPI003D77AEB5